MIHSLFFLGTVYLQENFDDDDWERRWVYSKHRPTKGEGIMGTFRLTSGSYFGDQKKQRGIQTIDDCGWYQLTSKLNKPFNTTGKDLVVQYTLRLEGGYETAGGYIKLLGPETKQMRFNAESPYLLMFGPDLNKPNTHKLMFLINRNNTNYDIHKFIECQHDELTHSYTLIIRANRTYEIRIDGDTVEGGSLDVDFETTGPVQIPDPNDTMPDDWDNRAEIDDPEDVKPSNWDDRPTIDDPTAKKPSDWRERVNGPWIPPQIKNPDFLGEWKPRRIPNPNYKGDWEPRMIDNPDYAVDPVFGVWENISYIGIEVFQTKAGSIFDNFLITDDVEYAEKQLRENFLSIKEEEYKMFKRVQMDRQAEEEYKRLKEQEERDQTDAAFYSSGSSSSDSSSEDPDPEREANFIINKIEVSNEDINASLFEFPYDVDFNEYFIKKAERDYRIKSKKNRDDYYNHRQEVVEEKEWPEGYFGVGTGVERKVVKESQFDDL